MKTFALLIASWLVAGSAFAADQQKIVVAMAKPATVAKAAAAVKAPVAKKEAADDKRFDNYALESFNSNGLPQ